MGRMKLRRMWVLSGDRAYGSRPRAPQQVLNSPEAQDGDF